MKFSIIEGNKVKVSKKSIKNVDELVSKLPDAEVIYLGGNQMRSDIDENINLVCPECGREISNYYDRDYALISHPFSSDPKNKVCIYCAMRIQKEVMDREQKEHAESLEKKLPGLLPKLLKDSEFRSIFQKHLRRFGNKVESVLAIVTLRKSVYNLMYEHIYPKYHMDFYFEMNEEDFKTVSHVIYEYIPHLSFIAASRITQTVEKMKERMPEGFDLEKLLSFEKNIASKHKNNDFSLVKMEQKQAFFDDVIKDCCHILDEEIEIVPSFVELVMSYSPKETDIRYFLKKYKNGSSNLKVWHFTSRDKKQVVAMIFPDCCSSLVHFINLFEISIVDADYERMYIFSKEVIERIDIPSDRDTACMIIASLEIVMERLQERDVSLKSKYQAKINELKKTFEIDFSRSDCIVEIDESNNRNSRYEDAINGKGDLTVGDIARYYRATKRRTIECIFNKNFTLEEKELIISQFVEQQNRICKNQFMLPRGIIDIEPYRKKIKMHLEDSRDIILIGADPKSLIIYFHHWRIIKDEDSLNILLDKVYTMMKRVFVYDLELYFDSQSFIPGPNFLDDRLPYFTQINQCCNLIELYLTVVTPVIQRMSEEELARLKYFELDMENDEPAEFDFPLRFSNEGNEIKMHNEGEIYDDLKKKLSNVEMRHASLLNMELTPETRKIVDGRLYEKAKNAFHKRMETAAAEITIDHIGTMLNIVSLMMDIIGVLPEVSSNLYKKEKQQLLKVKGRLRKLLMEMEKITFVEAEIYEEYLFNHNINIIRVNEESSSRYKDQFNCFMMSLDLIGAKDIVELMEQRRRFILKFNLDPELDHNMSLFLERLTERIQESLKDSDSYSARWQQIHDQLSVYNVFIHESVVSTLATAEELYYKFIDGRKPNEYFDYSCIAIMYFQALENLLNRVIYTPYKVSWLEPNIRDVYQSYKTQNIYLPSSNNMSYYFSEYKNVNTCRLSDDITLGSFPFLFKNVRTIHKFREFLQSTFHKQNLEIKKLRDFGENMRDIANRRNDAAHGSKALDRKTVIHDRNLVYNENKAASAQIKAAIMQFLSFFN